MARSSGYRAKAGVRKEVDALRAKLHTLKDDKWVLASYIMGEITSLLGHTGGPSGSRIEPRACKWCHFYGHTRQHCEKRKAYQADYERRYLEALAEENRRIEEGGLVEEQVPYDPRQTAQALTFDSLGLPYRIHDICGPVIAAVGDECHGQWAFDAQGVSTCRAKS